MGKSRRNRTRAHHSGPIQPRPVKPPSDPELVTIRETKVLPVLKDLSSSQPKNRSAAAQAIANIIEDPKCRKLLLREQVVYTVLTETLTDTSLESRAAGWFILKVLAEKEDADFCIHLYRQDILTAMDYAAQRVTESMPALDSSSKSLPEAEKGFTWTIIASLVSMTMALTAASDEISDAVGNVLSIGKLLVALAAPERYPQQPDIVDDALSCLLIVSEDNVRLAEHTLNDVSLTRKGSGFATLLAGKGSWTSQGAVACGILHNFFAALEWDDSIPGPGDACDAILVAPLSKILEGGTPGTSISQEPHWTGTFSVIQLALEILASIGTNLQRSMERRNTTRKDLRDINPADADGPRRYSETRLFERRGTDKGQKRGEDDNEGSGEEEYIDSDEEMGEDEIERDMEMVTGVDDNAMVIDEMPTIKELMQSAVPKIISLVDLDLAKETNIHLPKPTSTLDGHDIKTRLQYQALETLSNIVWSISCIDFSADQNASILDAWTPVGITVWEEIVLKLIAKDTTDMSLAARLVGLAWAVARSLRGQVPLDKEAHQKFFALYEATKGKVISGLGPEVDADPFQGLGVKCIGVLGQLAMHPAPVPLTREIGGFLLELMKNVPAKPPADAVEALNQLIDIYQDDDISFDQEVFQADDYLGQLERILPRMKTMAKMIDRRVEGELRSRADEAVVNLRRFIQYKNARQNAKGETEAEA